MPFIDLNKQQNIQPYDNADVLIIGAGAAGILLAVELTKENKKVVLIESGDFFINEKKQQLNDVVFSNKTLPSAIHGRYRAIGGTTLIWGGGSMPFSKFDFEEKDWILLSGWPIGYDEISPYYNAANKFMGIDELDYKNNILKKIGLKDPGFNNNTLDYHVCKWAPEPNFQILYRDYLEKNVTVIYNCVFQKFEKKENLEISGVYLSNFEEQGFFLNAKIIIVAAGGIESNRILLNNNLGNHSGWLGKCFMEHPCIEIGEVLSENNYQLQKYFNTRIWQRRKYSIRLSLNDKLQEDKKLLNCSASIMFTPPADVFNPYAELLSFKKDFKLKRLLKVSSSLKSISKSIWAYIIGHFYYKVNAKNKIVLMVEQEPIEQSNISLSNDKDIFDINKAHINWDISHKTWETICVISHKLKEEIESLEFGKVNLYPQINSETKDWLTYLSDVNHHMGGTRMSISADKGVVDLNLKVWNVPNLYICSCSVFPTSSHSNPTLTLLALGKRLCKHLIDNKNIEE